MHNRGFYRTVIGLSSFPCAQGGSSAPVHWKSLPYALIVITEIIVIRICLEIRFKDKDGTVTDNYRDVFIN